MRAKILAAICFALMASSASAEIAGITPCSPNSLSVTASSSNVALSSCGPVVIVYNISAQEAFYKLGATSSVAATTTVTDSFSLPGNAFVVLQVSAIAPGFIAAITATSTTTLRIVQGWAQP